MSLIAKITKISKLNVPRTSLNTFFRTASMWNKDWKPGPYPRTEAERKAAALKYGLEPSEYQPYPDDGTGHGDYPMLPERSAESKDPYYTWDFPELKKNLHETMQLEEDMYGETRFYINQRLRISLREQVLTFVGVMLALYGIYEVLDPYPMFRPVKPKQLAADGKTHYTFELE